MSSLPSEVLEDVLQPLDRWTLDDVQFTDERFLRLIEERLSDVCLRQITYATFRAPEENTDDSSYAIHIDGPPERRISNAHGDTARLFSEFVQALWSSRIASLYLSRLVFEPELATLLLQAPITADALTIVDSSCAELTTAQFRELLLHFSATRVDIYSCRLRACQVTDELLQGLSKGRLRRANFEHLMPVDGSSFHVTDNAIVDFCVAGNEEDASKQKTCGELVVHNGSFTKNLFKRLVEASSASMRTQPLRITVSPCPLKEENLRDFAQYLSYHHGLRIYDFPAEQHGAAAAMDTQIVLNDEDNKLTLVRAQRSNPYFAFY